LFWVDEHAVLKEVTQQIGAAIGTQARLHCNFKSNLEKLRMLLESVAAVLMDAERRSIKDAAVRLCLDRLKNAMYGISNLIDEYEANTNQTSFPKVILYGNTKRATGIRTQRRIASIHSRSRPAIRIDRSGVAERATDPEPCNYALDAHFCTAPPSPLNFWYN
jgi:hypothetical protein